MNGTEIDAQSCHTKSYNRTIFQSNCIPKRVELQHCHGRCNSFYLPGNEGYQDTLTYCTRCIPSKSHWRTVKLVCKSKTGKRQKKFKVEVIDSCACSPC